MSNHKLANLSFREQIKIDRFPLRFTVMVVALYFVGAGLALMMRGGVGVAPWDVLQIGIAQHTGISVGTVTIIVSFIILLLWIPLKERYGIGTIGNALLVGLSVDATLSFIPDAPNPWVGALMMVAGTVTHGAACALYIGMQLGSGPRDGLMTGLHHRFGFAVWKARTGIEITVTVLGMVLGGPFGAGTIFFALTIGPIIQWCLPKVLLPINNIRPAKGTP